MDISKIHQFFLQCKSISIDTRKIEAGDMFVAIKGERFDANAFVDQALSKGAAYVIVDNSDYFIDERTILVRNSLETLQELAKYHREYLKLPIVALTGSNGKTTTKELIHKVLSQKYKTSATIGNLNNHIGVPLTLLSFDHSTEIGIVEMGANHQNEIQFLCELATPDYGYVTNFGKAHLEGFGGVEGVIKGKSEMYADILSRHRKVFVNLDDPIQVSKTAGIERITFGVNHSEADTNIVSVTANPLVKVCLPDICIQSHLIGLYNANNINAAIAIGRYFNISDIQIKQAIENYVPENNRSQLLYKNSNKIILDAYNANPSSMNVAITNFLQLDEKCKFLVLGDMFELGEASHKEHRAIVDFISNEKSIESFLIGKHFYECRTNKDFLHFFETFEAFAAYIKKLAPKGGMILIKGSRGMALERTLEIL